MRGNSYALWATDQHDPSQWGSEQLIYAYTQGQLKPESFVPILGSFVRGSTSETTTVTFECDARGVLQGYTATQGQDASGSGFISGGRQR